MAKGICTNIGKPCSKALGNEVQEADESNFVCKECGKPLVPISGGDDPTLPKPRTRKKIIVAVAAVAMAVAIFLIVIFANKAGGSGGGEAPTPGPDTIVTPPEPTPESVTPVNSGGENSKQVEEVKDKPQEVTTPRPTSKSVLGGAATMTTNPQDGYITIKFKRSYQLDNGDMDHNTINISAGDQIYRANVRNGVLYGGQLQYGSGEEVQLSGIKVKL